MEQIKSFEDACLHLKIEPKLPDVSMLPERHQKALLAHCQLVIITEALNTSEDGETWKPDWDNHNEWKYYPWFVMSSSGFGFYGVDYRASLSSVGSRLCFRTRKLAEYAGKTFTDRYKDYFLID